MICKFSKKLFKKSLGWVRIIFAAGIALALISAVWLKSGSLIGGLALTGLALSAILISIGVRMGMYYGKCDSFVCLESNTVVYTVGSGTLVAADKTVYTIYRVDKLEMTPKAFMINGDIDVAKMNSKRRVSNLKIDRCYEHDEEIYNKLIGMERKWAWK